MIKKITLATLTILLAMAAMAQQDYCKGLKNPTSFVIGSAGNSANAQWYGFTGSKNATASQCGTWGMTGWGSQIAASQLATQSSGSSCTSSNSTDINNQQDYMNRFVIKGSGNDPLTSNHLSYLPPDNTYTSSIRLGNNCGGNHEAEMLCYQFNVRPQNSLVFIWYALSLQNGQHTVAENPEFAIEIEKKVGNNWVRVGGDTLCYIRPTPAGSGADVSPFYVGSTGQHNTGASYGCNIYLPWNKVAINLNKYLYETVRIKVGAGDCSMSAHYACAYIAGECQSMEIQTSGCPAGSTSTVQTLTAPKGLSNYVWYKSNSGMDGISSLMDVPDNINFTRLTPEQGDTSSYHYDCTLEDFYLTEGPNANTYTNIQVFRCDMTSYMNPDIPITSKVYVSVRNTKPAMAIDTIKTCESELTLINKSYVPNDMMGCDTSITKWWFYSGATTNTAYDTAIGGTAHHTWDSAGTYAVTVRSFNRDSLNCYTDSTYFIQVLGRPQHPTIDASDHEVCVNERVMLSDATPGSIRSDWYFDDGDEVPNVPRGQSVEKIFNNAVNTVRMVTYNGLSARDSVDTHLEIQCTSEIIDTIKVFKDPEILYEGDTVICNGQSTNVTASTEEACSYNWYATQDDSGTPVFTGQTLSVYPNQDSTTYYLLVTTLARGCKAWIPVTIHRVNPTLSISRHDMCEGDSVTLTSEKAFTYSWTASPADSSLDALLDSLGHGPATITVAPKETTVYTLVGHGTNDCSSSPLTEQITVHPVPVATVEMNPKFVDSDNPVVTFTDVSPYSVRRVWTFSEGTPEEYTSPCTHNFGEVSSDSVDITLAAYNDLECSDVLNFRIPVTQFTFYAPNAFTPERPDNNTFQIYTANEQENFSVFIYDRMGRLVYTSDDLHFKWNGNALDGTKLPQGAYAYVIYYRRPNTEDIVTQKGTVTLIR